MKKSLLAIVSAVLLLCWPSQLFAQAVTWGNVSASPSFASTNGALLAHWGIYGAPSFTSSNGTYGSTWQLGGSTGPQLSNNAGVIEARNAALSSFINVRGAAPVGNNDFAIKSYVDSGLSAITLATLTGVSVSNGCLTSTGGVFSWGTCGGGGGFSVTGTGLPWVASGTLNGAAVGFSGDATLGALSGSNVPLTLATVNSNVGTFGSSTLAPVITVNAKGLITAVTTAAITGGVGTSITGTGLWYNAAGSLNGAAVGFSGDATLGALSGGNVPITLASVATAGTTGSSTLIPVITINAKGLVTNISTATASPAFTSLTGHATVAQGGTGLTTLTANGILIGEGTSNIDEVVLGNAQILVGQTSADPQAKTVSGDATLSNAGALTLATVNANTGSFGSASSIPNFTVNAKGLITAASTNAVSISNTNLTAGTYSNITGVGTLTAGATGAGFTLNFGTSTLSGTVPNANQAAQTLSGDVTGNTGASVVSAISGTSPITINNASTLQWALGVGSPTFTQATQATNTNGVTMTIGAQSAGAGNANGGSLILNGGHPTGTGHGGQAQLNSGNGQYGLIVTDTETDFQGAKWNWFANIANPILGQQTQTSDIATNNLEIVAQSAFASATGTNMNGGNVAVVGGAHSGTFPHGTDGIAALEAGDGVTVIEAAPSETLAVSGQATSDIASFGQGTVTTQDTHMYRTRLYCRTVNSSQAACGGPIVGLVQTSKGASFWVHWVARDVTTNNVANDSTGTCMAGVHMTGTTMSYIGVSAGVCTDVGKLLGTGGNTAGAEVTIGSPGTGQIQFGVGGYSGTDTIDWTLEVTQLNN